MLKMFQKDWKFYGITYKVIREGNTSINTAYTKPMEEFRNNHLQNWNKTIQEAHNLRHFSFPASQKRNYWKNSRNCRYICMSRNFIMAPNQRKSSMKFKLALTLRKDPTISKETIFLPKKVFPSYWKLYFDKHLNFFPLWSIIFDILFSQNFQQAQSNCNIFRQSGCKMIDRTYNNRFSQYFWLNRKLSIETLLEEFKPKTSDDKFKYRQNNNSIFGLSWKFCCLCKNQGISIRRRLDRQKTAN